LESQFIGAFRIVLPSTWWTAACVRLTYPVVSTYNQPIGVSWACHDTIVASFGVDPALMQLKCLELVSGLSLGPKPEHRQLQITIKNSSICGATG